MGDGTTGWCYASYLEFVRAVIVPTTPTGGESAAPPAIIRNQLFRINNVEHDMNGVKVNAVHIFYDLSKNLVKNTKGKYKAGTALTTLMSDTAATHEFNIYTDITTTHEVEWVRENPVKAMLDPETGFVGIYGGQLVRDNYDIYIMSKAGADRGLKIQWRKNMLGVTSSESYENVATRFMPVGEDKDGNPLLLPELYVDSSHINDYPNPYVEALDVREAKEVTKGDDLKSKTQCYEEMRAAANAEFAKKVDLPELSVSVQWVNLGDTDEYAQYKNLFKLYLFDEVAVSHSGLGIEVKADVVRTVFDCILERYVDIELGNIRRTIASRKIASWQLPPASIKGFKLSPGTIGNGKLDPTVGEQINISQNETIIELKETSSPHTIILSNENQPLTTDSNGATTATTVISTLVDTFKGTARIAATIGTLELKNSAGATIAGATLTKIDPTETESGIVTMTVASGVTLAADSGYIKIPLTIEDKTYEKWLTWAKVKQGADAKYVEIVPSAQYFTTNSTGENPALFEYTPSLIVLTPTFQNVTYLKWQYSLNGTSWTDVTTPNGVTINGTTKALTIQSTSTLYSTSQFFVIFRVVTTTGESDTTTLHKLTNPLTTEARLSQAQAGIATLADEIDLRVLESTYVGEKIYNQATAPANPTTKMLWMNTATNKVMRWNGSAWVPAVADSVSNTGINISAGVIDFLGALMKFRVPVAGGDGDDMAMQIDNDGVNAPYIESSNYKFNGQQMFQKGANASFANPQGAISALGMIFTDPVTITLSSNYTGPLVMKNIFGKLTIDLDGYTINGYVDITGCSDVTIQNGKIIDTRTAGQTTGTVYIKDGSNVSLLTMDIDSNGRTTNGVQAISSGILYFNIVDIIRSASSCMSLILAPDTTVYDCRGDSTYGIAMLAGSFCKVSGEIPYGSTAHLHPVLGGQSFGTGTGTHSIQGGAPSAPTTKDFTATQIATCRGSSEWRYIGARYHQGEWDGQGINTGCMWWNNAAISTFLSGKTITGAKLTMHRNSGAGDSTAKSVYLYNLNNTGVSGTISRSTSRGAIGTWAWGETKTVDIPTAAVTAMLSGGGLCIYNGSSNYMYFDTKPTLTITAT